MVVEKQTEPQQPAWPQPGVVGQDETERPDDMRRDLPENFAFDQRLANQPELIIFQIAQPAVNELGRPRRCAARQIIHFTEENRISTPRRVAGDTAAIDAAADDSEVEHLTHPTFPLSILPARSGRRRHSSLSAILLSD